MENSKDKIRIEHVPAEADRIYAEDGPRAWENALNRYFQFEDALPEKSKRNVLNILNQRVHNKKLLRNGIIWFIVMLILEGVRTGIYGIGVVFLLLNIGLLTAAFISYRNRPHDSLMWLLPAMVVLFVLYFLISIY